MIEDFHFLRPWWLLAILLPIGIVWLASRSGNARNRWKDMIAPHLLEKLIVDASGGTRVRPSWLLAAVLALAVLGAAGPTWERETPPFVEDTAPLVLAVDLSPTMDAIDLTPSRLERAKLKIKDIIAQRQGTRTAVIAYAGSAHLVLPLTDDSSLIETYTDALATRIMPVDGKDTAAALTTAEQALSEGGMAGTVVFITDGVEQNAFDAFKRKTDNGILILGVGTAEGGPVKTPDGGFLTGTGGSRVFAKLDVDALKNLHALTGIDVATITDDDADVRWITQRVATNFAQKKSAQGDRWKDAGWLLLAPAAVLFALTFRRGWVVRLGTAFILARLVFMPTSSHAAGFADMWLTPDQQGRIAFERGNYDDAATRFHDPMWRGVALYRAGKFAEAVDAFAAVDSAESWYNQGNSLLFLSKFEEAVTAYKKSLDKRKEWPEAKANLAIAENLLATQKDEEQEQQQDPNQKPDEVKFDDKGKKGKAGQVDVAEQTSEMWMKNLQVSPADLMARKFAIEMQEKKP
ncbi:Ca-activated chloride channel family protein [Rhizobium sp. BK181]|uniref:VWA domain-containing protein n=1 Tax=Rhizobium sp. BK181 TaxID=2587072 RepID=UPI001609AF8D|nr:VWA domain-containing protein [Rhizobium sp. BK181]MBB3315671.1 Ca-activated chloride channel family protein [Rhizobium sp. BK181]